MAAMQQLLGEMRSAEIGFLRDEVTTERARRSVALIIGVGSIVTALLALGPNGLLDRFATDQQRTVT
jgi:hypothetical protein